ncbi:hypothetical protein H045_04875 [Pseudomonas poae RE*1-1-14]|nr:hypothetical protein H045_04875 [Pseudomonas poae RE*1-1-14]
MIEVTLKLIADSFPDLIRMSLSIETCNADSPARRSRQAGDQIQQCRLSRTTFPEQTNAFLALSAKRKVMNQFSFAQVLCNTVYLEHVLTE